MLEDVACVSSSIIIIESEVTARATARLQIWKFREECSGVSREKAEKEGASPEADKMQADKKTKDTRQKRETAES